MDAISRWEHFNHDADIGIRGIGSSMASAFEQAALALTAVICDPKSVVPRHEIPIECEGQDIEFLFINWINALVYEMATRRMLFSEFSVRLEKGRLLAHVRGEPIDVVRHQPSVEVKGATLTELEVAEDESGIWHAQCVIDV